MQSISPSAHAQHDNRQLVFAFYGSPVGVHDTPEVDLADSSAVCLRELTERLGCNLDGQCDCACDC